MALAKGGGLFRKSPLRLGYRPLSGYSRYPILPATVGTIHRS
ncbi:hypothetical protein [Paenibacillus nuruki]|nr:hypothetical protein [Paenibacillus nuruki]